MFIYIDIYVEITFQAQNGATTALSAMSANQNLENFRVSVHVPIDQKFPLFCQPFPKCQANFGLYTYFLVPYSFSLPSFYSLSYKSFLSSASGSLRVKTVCFMKY